MKERWKHKLSVQIVCVVRRSLAVDTKFSNSLQNFVERSKSRDIVKPS